MNMASIRTACMLAAVSLWGCSTPGTILQLPPADPGAAALLTVPERDSVWVIPLKSKNPEEMPVSAEGLWVTSGWFTIEYQCFFPKNHPDKAVVPGGSTAKPFFIESGHRYSLKCDAEKAGVIDLSDIGSTTDARKHP